MLLIMLPVTIGYGFGIFYFVKLEKEAGNYPNPLMISLNLVY